MRVDRRYIYGFSSSMAYQGFTKDLINVDQVTSCLHFNTLKTPHYNRASPRYAR
jgi:hypothetical protein